VKSNSPKAASSSDPGPPWDEAFAWIEKSLGGRIAGFERQARWRPAFFIDLERNTGSLSLYLRGARGEIENGQVRLEYEMRVLQQLEADGIPVPHVHGFTPGPAGVLMDRCPGRANLATADDDAQRHAVLDDYIDILARCHRLDTEPYRALGMTRPTSDEEIGLCDLASWEGGYRKGKARPEPIIEFTLKWLRRNIPTGRKQISFLSADSGQFLYKGNKVTGLIDLELACLGDPAADLAGMRGRDLSEPLGDLPRAFKRYFEIMGEEIPTSVLDFHSVRFNLYTPMAIAGIVARPSPAIDLIQYLGWYWVWSRACLEVMAHGIGLDLPSAPPATPVSSRFSGAHDALAGRLERSAKGDGFAAYELDTAYRMAEYLKQVERFGAEFEERDRGEVAALIGKSVGDWCDTDEKLEQFIAAAGPESDGEIIRVLHARTLRHEVLLGSVLREIQGVSIQLLDR
jgi:hypothetical protein